MPITTTEQQRSDERAEKMTARHAAERRLREALQNLPKAVTTTPASAPTLVDLLDAALAANAAERELLISFNRIAGEAAARERIEVEALRARLLGPVRALLDIADRANVIVAFRDMAPLNDAMLALRRAVGVDDNARDADDDDGLDDDR